jgi:arylsulfatase A-like enzyme
MAEANTQPNVLLILTDQHRADHVGFAGNTEVRTPNLDALAAESVVFERTYVANPICMPNRASLFTGVMPSSHGTRYNGIPLDWSANTFARVLRKAGYRTGYFGKCHLQTMGSSPIRMAQWQQELPPDDGRHDPHPPEVYEWENRERHRNGWVDVPPDFYGFDHARFIVDHADFCSGHYYQWLLAQGIDPEAIQGPGVAQRYPGEHTQLWRTAVPVELYPSTYVANEAIDFLSAAGDEPFFAVCSFSDPHHPFTPPGEYFDAFDPNALSLPASFWDRHEQSMPQFQHMVAHRGEIPGGVLGFSPTETQFRDMLAKVYGMLALVDDCVGRLVSAVGRDTIVVFTSDHGDAFGDHGLMLKHGIHYDANTHVALTIRAPGKAPARTRSFASTLDIAPTLLELTGCRRYFGMQGESLVPLLEDVASSVRDSVVVEEDQLFANPGTDVPVRMRTLITDEGRFTQYHGFSRGDLFDHRDDPSEMNNLWAQHGARDLRLHMSERLMDATMRYATSNRRARYTA